MDLTMPLLTGALLALFSGIQIWINKGRFDHLEHEIGQLRSDVSSEIGQFRTEVSGEIAALRSDLLHVAIAATGRRSDD